MGIVLTHFFGPPKVRPTSFPDVDVPDAVCAWARERLAVAAAAGIPAGRIVIDPGVGLGKSPEQDLDLLHRIDEVVALGRPVLIPISNKKVLGAITGQPAKRRLAGTTAGMVWSPGARGDRLPGPQRPFPTPGPHDCRCPGHGPTGALARRGEVAAGGASLDRGTEDHRRQGMKLFIDTADLADIETIAGWEGPPGGHHQPDAALEGRGRGRRHLPPGLRAGRRPGLRRGRRRRPAGT